MDRSSTGSQLTRTQINLELTWNQNGFGQVKLNQNEMFCFDFPKGNVKMENFQQNEHFPLENFNFAETALCPKIFRRKIPNKL